MGWLVITSCCVGEEDKEDACQWMILDFRFWILDSHPSGGPGVDGNPKSKNPKSKIEGQTKRSCGVDLASKNALISLAGFFVTSSFGVSAYQSVGK